MGKIAAGAFSPNLQPSVFERASTIEVVVLRASAFENANSIADWFTVVRTICIGSGSSSSFTCMKGTIQRAGERNPESVVVGRETNRRNRSVSPTRTCISEVVIVGLFHHKTLGADRFRFEDGASEGWSTGLGFSNSSTRG
jgi:hypothetical protein